MNKIICIAGPTASGKTALSIALAKELDGEWVTVLDESTNEKDMLIDYKPLKEMKAQCVRLTIKGHPEGVAPAVTNFTVFGYWK